MDRTTKSIRDGGIYKDLTYPCHQTKCESQNLIQNPSKVPPKSSFSDHNICILAKLIVGSKHVSGVTFVDSSNGVGGRCERGNS